MIINIDVITEWKANAVSLAIYKGNHFAEINSLIIAIESSFYNVSPLCGSQTRNGDVRCDWKPKRQRKSEEKKQLSAHVNIQWIDARRHYCESINSQFQVYSFFISLHLSVYLPFLPFKFRFVFDRIFHLYFNILNNLKLTSRWLRAMPSSLFSHLMFLVLEYVCAMPMSWPHSIDNIRAQIFHCDVHFQRFETRLPIVSLRRLRTSVRRFLAAHTCRNTLASRRSMAGWLRERLIIEGLFAFSALVQCADVKISFPTLSNASRSLCIGNRIDFLSTRRSYSRLNGTIGRENIKCYHFATKLNMMRMRAK